jgi:carboxyl-terminal processing protease
MNMRIYLLIAAALLAAISFQHRSYGQVLQTADDPLRHGHALLIGNAQYRDSGWATLADIPLQLGALERGLKNHFDTVEVVQNIETEQLRQKVNGFLRDYGNDSNARLFIYYAGHGYTEPIFQRSENWGYITGVDTPAVNGSLQAYDAARRKAILMSEIRDASANVLAKHILFVFDSCFAGTIFTTRAGDSAPTMLTPDVVAKLIEKPSRDFITAGRDNERVPANSPISGFFLSALNGAADLYGHGVISAAEIHQYLRNRVLPLQSLGVNLTPQYGRHPFAAFAEGDFLFRVTKSPAPRLTKADITKLFSPFNTALKYVQSSYVETPDEMKLFLGAIEGMKTAFFTGQNISITKETPELTSITPNAGSSGKIDVNALYDAALKILNEFNSDGNDVRLVTSAIKGTLAKLDPRSSYMDSESLREMQVANRGVFGGLGIEVTLEGGLIKVVAPLDNTPAAKAGIMSNDIITKVADEQVQGLTLNQAVNKMRGPVNSTVKLTIMREGQDNPIEVSLTRQTIRVLSVRSRLEGDDVAYIRITRFSEQTTEGLHAAIKDLTNRAGGKLKGYIIDLRNNSGGLLDQVISVSDTFLESGEITSTRGRNDNQRFNARPGDLTNNKPIIVLINGGTASGSEIAAGALQDHKRATIIGTRSFGLGSIQTVIPLGPGNGRLLLTTARNFTPSGRSIQGAGIVPDIEVLQDVPEEFKGPTTVRGETQTGSQSYVPLDSKDDKALNTALTLIRIIQRN